MAMRRLITNLGRQGTTILEAEEEYIIAAEGITLLAQNLNHGLESATEI